MRVLVAGLCVGCGAEPAQRVEPVVPRVEAAAVETDAPSVQVSAARAVVYLAPLGRFDEALLDAVASALQAELQVEVRRLETHPLPKAAWYAPRRRYRAEKLLDHLETLIPAGEPASTRILGLTQKDISTTKGDFKDWGIFGLGNMPGQAAVLSSHRLRRKAKNAAHVRKRVVNTAIHEVGHTLGLDHCTEAAQRCPMQDAEGGIANTDSSSGHLGPQCRAELEREVPRPD
ncbi:MAG: archaemetzincin [Myxococcota bacterium]